MFKAVCLLPLPYCFALTLLLLQPFTVLALHFALSCTSTYTLILRLSMSLLPSTNLQDFITQALHSIPAKLLENRAISQDFMSIRVWAFPGGLTSG